MRKLSTAMGSLLALIASPAAFCAALPVTPQGVVGVSIGTDLTVDARFGDGGYTVIDYDDDEGTQDEAVRLLPADDGGSWLLGFHRTEVAADRFAIAKLDADGRLDASYGLGGHMLVPTDVSYIRDVILVDGRFYAAGMHLLTSSGPGVVAVACVQTDGAPCAGFGENGTVTIAVNDPGLSSEAMRILHRDGKLYAIGNTDPGGGLGHSSAIAIAKLDAATGALDESFGDGSGPLPGTVVFDPELYPGGYDFAYAAAFAADGKVLVGGSAQNNDNQGSDGFVLAFDPATGALDPAFGDGGYRFFSFQTGVHFDHLAVRAMHVRDDGRILLAGDANHDDEFWNTLTDVLLASLEPDGSPTPGFGVDGVARINVGLNTETLDMAVRANGDLVVSMASNGLLPNPYTSDMLQSIAQFDASGNGPTATVSISYPAESSPGGRPNSLLVDAHDRVLVAGFRLWGWNWPVPDSDHTVTRLLRDGVFADGFDF
jgi:uncharacterized delta-60 repeat protein